MSIEAMKQALEALENEKGANNPLDWHHDKAITAIKEALAEPEQEPVAKAMTAHRAAYFMERFKHEEKLLGPNEQAALDFVISMLEAQPAVTEQHKQEPVAHVCVFPLRGDEFFPQTRIEWKNGRPVAGPLYTTPPQRQWVGLTEEEVIDLWPDLIMHRHTYQFWQNLEAKLKEKNT